MNAQLFAFLFLLGMAIFGVLFGPRLIIALGEWEDRRDARREAAEKAKRAGR